MAGSRGPLLEVTIPASADLSANQYRIVGINSSGSAVVPGNASTPYFGIMSNKPAGAGRGARVTVQGIEKLEAGAAWTPGDLIQCVAGGRGSPISADGTAAGTGYVIGMAISPAGGSAELAEVLITNQYLNHG